jgi:hypothetical protein
LNGCLSAPNTSNERCAGVDVFSWGVCGDNHRGSGRVSKGGLCGLKCQDGLVNAWGMWVKDLLAFG